MSRNNGRNKKETILQNVYNILSDTVTWIKHTHYQQVSLLVWAYKGEGGNIGLEVF